MKTRVSKLRAAIAAFAAASLAAIGLAGGASVAVAAPGNIDANATGSIIIHKYQNGTGTTGTGSVDTAGGVTGVTVEGVKFSVQKLDGVDLLTNQGWSDLNNLVVAGDGSVTLNGTAVTLGAASEVTTDAQGSATAPNLSVGVYLVTETDVTGAKIDGQAVTVTEKAAPFLVTIPLNKDGAWLYDVNVYPKNTVITDKSTPVKEVDASKAYFPGDPISWTITQTLPDPGKDANGAAKTFTKYEITDTLPAGVETVAEDAVTVTHTSAMGGESATAAKTVEGNTVTVSFTGDELAKLAAGDTVSVKIDAKVAESAATLTNKAIVAVNDQTLETNEVTTDFTTLTINKVNDKGESLDGAEFVITPMSGLNIVDNPSASVNVSTKTLTTVNGTASQTLAVGTYKVTETKAPAGYGLSPDYEAGQIVEVTKDGQVIEVVNLPVDNPIVPNLPLTGAQGMMIMMLLGGALMAAAVGFGVLYARKHR